VCETYSLQPAILCTTLAAFGQRFSTNGHQLYLRCEGKRSAFTVVLIAGGGGSTETWDKVQSPISKFAEVCSYDRLGLGNSDHLDSDSQQSVSQIVADLDALLKAAKIQPPYLLVGHSIVVFMREPSTSVSTIKWQA
jgi:pimeloyl-ACP methyl ester carboxylesterase